MSPDADQACRDVARAQYHGDVAQDQSPRSLVQARGFVHRLDGQQADRTGQYDRGLYRPDIELWEERYQGVDTNPGDLFAPLSEQVSDEIVPGSEVDDAVDVEHFQLMQMHFGRP